MWRNAPTVAAIIFFCWPQPHKLASSSTTGVPDNFWHEQFDGDLRNKPPLVYPQNTPTPSSLQQQAYDHLPPQTNPEQLYNVEESKNEQRGTNQQVPSTLQLFRESQNLASNKNATNGKPYSYQLDGDLRNRPSPVYPQNGNAPSSGSLPSVQPQSYNYHQLPQTNSQQLDTVPEDSQNAHRSFNQQAAPSHQQIQASQNLGSNQNATNGQASASTTATPINIWYQPVDGDLRNGPTFVYPQNENIPSFIQPQAYSYHQPSQRNSQQPLTVQEDSQNAQRNFEQNKNATNGNSILSTLPVLAPPHDEQIQKESLEIVPRPISADTLRSYVFNPVDGQSLLPLKVPSLPKPSWSREGSYPTHNQVDPNNAEASSLVLPWNRNNQFSIPLLNNIPSFNYESGIDTRRDSEGPNTEMYNEKLLNTFNDRERTFFLGHPQNVYYGERELEPLTYSKEINSQHPINNLQTKAQMSGDRIQHISTLIPPFPFNVYQDLNHSNGSEKQNQKIDWYSGSRNVLSNLTPQTTLIPVQIPIPQTIENGGIYIPTETSVNRLPFLTPIISMYPDYFGSSKQTERLLSPSTNLFPRENVEKNAQRNLGNAIQSSIQNLETDIRQQDNQLGNQKPSKISNNTESQILTNEMKDQQPPNNINAHSSFLSLPLMPKSENFRPQPFNQVPVYGHSYQPGGLTNGPIPIASLGPFGIPASRNYVNNPLRVLPIMRPVVVSVGELPNSVPRRPPSTNPTSSSRLVNLKDPIDEQIHQNNFKTENYDHTSKDSITNGQKGPDFPRIIPILTDIGKTPLDVNQPPHAWITPFDIAQYLSLLHLPRPRDSSGSVISRGNQIYIPINEQSRYSNALQRTPNVPTLQTKNSQNFPQETPNHKGNLLYTQRAVDRPNNDSPTDKGNDWNTNFKSDSDSEALLNSPNYFTRDHKTNKPEYQPSKSEDQTNSMTNSESLGDVSAFRGPEWESEVKTDQDVISLDKNIDNESYRGMKGNDDVKIFGASKDVLEGKEKTGSRYVNKKEEATSSDSVNGEILTANEGEANLEKYEIPNIDDYIREKIKERINFELASKFDNIKSDEFSQLPLNKPTFKPDEPAESSFTEEYENNPNAQLEQHGHRISHTWTSQTNYPENSKIPGDGRQVITSGQRFVDISSYDKGDDETTSDIQRLSNKLKYDQYMPAQRVVDATTAAYKQQTIRKLNTPSSELLEDHQEQDGEGSNDKLARAGHQGHRTPSKIDTDLDQGIKQQPVVDGSDATPMIVYDEGLLGDVIAQHLLEESKVNNVTNQKQYTIKVEFPKHHTIEGKMKESRTMTDQSTREQNSESTQNNMKPNLYENSQSIVENPNIHEHDTMQQPWNVGNKIGEFGHIDHSSTTLYEGIQKSPPSASRYVENEATPVQYEQSTLNEDWKKPKISGRVSSTDRLEQQEKHLTIEESRRGGETMDYEQYMPKLQQFDQNHQPANSALQQEKDSSLPQEGRYKYSTIPGEMTGGDVLTSRRELLNQDHYISTDTTEQYERDVYDHDVRHSSYNGASRTESYNGKDQKVQDHLTTKTHQLFGQRADTKTVSNDETTQSTSSNPIFSSSNPSQQPDRNWINTAPGDFGGRKITEKSNVDNERRRPIENQNLTSILPEEAPIENYGQFKLKYNEQPFNSNLSPIRGSNRSKSSLKIEGPEAGSEKNGIILPDKTNNTLFSTVNLLGSRTGYQRLSSLDGTSQTEDSTVVLEQDDKDVGLSSIPKPYSGQRDSSRPANQIYNSSRGPTNGTNVPNVDNTSRKTLDDIVTNSNSDTVNQSFTEKSGLGRAGLIEKPILASSASVNPSIGKHEDIHLRYNIDPKKQTESDQKPLNYPNPSYDSGSVKSKPMSGTTDYNYEEESSTSIEGHQYKVNSAFISADTNRRVVSQIPQKHISPYDTNYEDGPRTKPERKDSGSYGQAGSQVLTHQQPYHINTSETSINQSDKPTFIPTFERNGVHHKSDSDPQNVFGNREDAENKPLLDIYDADRKHPSTLGNLQTDSSKEALELKYKVGQRGLYEEIDIGSDIRSDLPMHSGNNTTTLAPQSGGTLKSPTSSKNSPVMENNTDVMLNLGSKRLYNTNIPSLFNSGKNRPFTDTAHNVGNDGGRPISRNKYKVNVTFDSGDIGRLKMSRTETNRGNMDDAYESSSTMPNGKYLDSDDQMSVPNLNYDQPKQNRTTTTLVNQNGRALQKDKSDDKFQPTINQNVYKINNDTTQKYRADEYDENRRHTSSFYGNLQTESFKGALEQNTVHDIHSGQRAINEDKGAYEKHETSAQYNAQNGHSKATTSIRYLSTTDIPAESEEATESDGSSTTYDENSRNKEYDGARMMNDPEQNERLRKGPITTKPSSTQKLEYDDFNPTNILEVDVSPKINTQVRYNTPRPDTTFRGSKAKIALQGGNIGQALNQDLTDQQKSSSSSTVNGNQEISFKSSPPESSTMIRTPQNDGKGAVEVKNSGMLVDGNFRTSLKNEPGKTSLSETDPSIRKTIAASSVTPNIGNINTQQSVNVDATRESKLKNLTFSSRSESTTMQQNTDERTKQVEYKNYRKTTADPHQTPNSGQRINQQQAELPEKGAMKAQDLTHDQALSMGSTIMTNPSSSTIGSTFQNSGQRLTESGIESTEPERKEQQLTENSLIHFYYASEDSNDPIITDLTFPSKVPTDIKRENKPVSPYSNLTPQLIPLNSHKATTSEDDEINVHKKPGSDQAKSTSGSPDDDTPFNSHLMSPNDGATLPIFHRLQIAERKFTNPDHVSFDGKRNSQRDDLNNDPQTTSSHLYTDAQNITRTSGTHTKPNTLQTRFDYIEVSDPTNSDSKKEPQSMPDFIRQHPKDENFSSRNLSADKNLNTRVGIQSRNNESNIASDLSTDLHTEGESSYLASGKLVESTSNYEESIQESKNNEGNLEVRWERLRGSTVPTESHNQEKHSSDGLEKGPDQSANSAVTLPPLFYLLGSSRYSQLHDNIGSSLEDYSAVNLNKTHPLNNDKVTDLNNLEGTKNQQFVKDSVHVTNTGIKSLTQMNHDSTTNSLDQMQVHVRQNGSVMQSGHGVTDISYREDAFDGNSGNVTTDLNASRSGVTLSSSRSEPLEHSTNGNLNNIIMTQTGWKLRPQSQERLETFNNTSNLNHSADDPLVKLSKSYSTISESSSPDRNHSVQSYSNESSVPNSLTQTFHKTISEIETRQSQANAMVPSTTRILQPDGSSNVLKQVDKSQDLQNSETKAYDGQRTLVAKTKGDPVSSISQPKSSFSVLEQSDKTLIHNTSKTGLYSKQSMVDQKDTEQPIRTSIDNKHKDCKSEALPEQLVLVRVASEDVDRDDGSDDAENKGRYSTSSSANTLKSNGELNLLELKDNERDKPNSKSRIYYGQRTLGDLEDEEQSPSIKDDGEHGGTLIDPSTRDQQMQKEFKERTRENNRLQNLINSQSKLYAYSDRRRLGEEVRSDLQSESYGQDTSIKTQELSDTKTERKETGDGSSGQQLAISGKVSASGSGISEKIQGVTVRTEPGSPHFNKSSHVPEQDDKVLSKLTSGYKYAQEAQSLTRDKSETEGTFQIVSSPPGGLQSESSTSKEAFAGQTAIEKQREEGNDKHIKTSSQKNGNTELKFGKSSASIIEPIDTFDSHKREGNNLASSSTGDLQAGNSIDVLKQQDRHQQKLGGQDPDQKTDLQIEAPSPNNYTSSRQSTNTGKSTTINVISNAKSVDGSDKKVQKVLSSTSITQDQSTLGDVEQKTDRLNDPSSKTHSYSDQMALREKMGEGADQQQIEPNSQNIDKFDLQSAALGKPLANTSEPNESSRMPVLSGQRTLGDEMSDGSDLYTKPSAQNADKVDLQSAISGKPVTSQGTPKPKNLIHEDPSSRMPGQSVQKIQGEDIDDKSGTKQNRQIDVQLALSGKISANTTQSTGESGGRREEDSKIISIDILDPNTRIYPSSKSQEYSGQRIPEKKRVDGSDLRITLPTPNNYKLDLQSKMFDKPSASSTEVKDILYVLKKGESENVSRTGSTIDITKPNNPSSKIPLASDQRTLEDEMDDSTNMQIKSPSLNNDNTYLPSAIPGKPSASTNQPNSKLGGRIDVESKLVSSPMVFIPAKISVDVPDPNIRIYPSSYSGKRIPEKKRNDESDRRITLPTPNNDKLDLQSEKFGKPSASAIEVNDKLYVLKKGESKNVSSTERAIDITKPNNLVFHDLSSKISVASGQRTLGDEIGDSTDMQMKSLSLNDDNPDLQSAISGKSASTNQPTSKPNGHKDETSKLPISITQTESGLKITRQKIDDGSVQQSQSTDLHNDQLYLTSVLSGKLSASTIGPNGKSDDRRDGSSELESSPTIIAPSSIDTVEPNSRVHHDPSLKIKVYSGQRFQGEESLKSSDLTNKSDRQSADSGKESASNITTKGRTESGPMQTERLEFSSSGIPQPPSAMDTQVNNSRLLKDPSSKSQSNSGQSTTGEEVDEGNKDKLERELGTVSVSSSDHNGKIESHIGGTVRVSSRDLQPGKASDVLKQDNTPKDHSSKIQRSSTKILGEDIGRGSNQHEKLSTSNKVESQDVQELATSKKPSTVDKVSSSTSETRRGVTVQKESSSKNGLQVDSINIEKLEHPVSTITNDYSGKQKLEEGTVESSKLSGSSTLSKGDSEPGPGDANIEHPNSLSSSQIVKPAYMVGESDKEVNVLSSKSSGQSSIRDDGTNQPIKSLVENKNAPEESPKPGKSPNGKAPVTEETSRIPFTLQNSNKLNPSSLITEDPDTYALEYQRALKTLQNINSGNFKLFTAEYFIELIQRCNCASLKFLIPILQKSNSGILVSS